MIDVASGSSLWHIGHGPHCSWYCWLVLAAPSGMPVLCIAVSVVADFFVDGFVDVLPLIQWESVGVVGALLDGACSWSSPRGSWLCFIVASPTAGSRWNGSS